MKMNAYSIFDTKALQYHLPFFQPADGAAVRMLMDLANDPNTTIGRHPSDFVLYQVGHYDDTLGDIQPCAPLRHVIDAVALVRIQPSLFPEDPSLQPERLPLMSNGEAK